MKAIILARVSTEEQMNEGQSIPAQLARAREYTKIKGLTIQNEYQFDESSLKDRRIKFEQVIEEIKKSKEPVALIVETVDRLQRGFKESVLLDDFRKQGKLEIHFIRENLVIHRDSNSSEIQRWDLAVFVAKSFVLQISDNVKRTYEYKLKHGEWIGKAPIGYLNVVNENDNKDIILDPARAHLVAKMFELYATGNYSIRTLTKEMNQLRLRPTRKNSKPLTDGVIYATLQKPFYYGMMKVKGELYPHKYQPLISKELFDKVQQVRLGYHKKPFKYAAIPFALRGMIKCADERCGCTITPEMHKGKFVYYSCTNYKRIHEKRIYVREEDLLVPIHEVLKDIQLSDEKIREITEDLKKVNQAKNEFHKQSLTTLRAEYDLYQNRIDKSYDLLLDGSITKDMFNGKLKEYKEKQAEIEEKMQQYTDADENFYLTANMTLNLAKRAHEIFQSSEPQEKRQLLNFLLQNLKLQGKNLSFELKTPFDTVLQASKCSNWGG